MCPCVAGDEGAKLKVPAALSKIDVSGILFFFGILLSIGALDSAGILQSLAIFLQTHVPSEQVIATVIGMASAVIDNVPLVAATMGMYDLQTNPQVKMMGAKGLRYKEFGGCFFCACWLGVMFLCDILSMRRTPLFGS